MFEGGLQSFLFGVMMGKLAYLSFYKIIYFKMKMATK